MVFLSKFCQKFCQKKGTKTKSETSCQTKGTATKKRHRGCIRNKKKIQILLGNTKETQEMMKKSNLYDHNVYQKQEFKVSKQVNPWELKFKISYFSKNTTAVP